MGPLAIAALVTGGLAVGRLLFAWVLLARHLRHSRIPSIPRCPTPPITLLKPLYGDEPGLAENLVATLRQNYPEFEVLWLHERPDDPALAAVDAAEAAVPDVPTRRVGGRAPEAANPKVGVLMVGAPGARHDLLASADSDVRPDPLYLRDIANALADADAVSFLPVLFGMRTLGGRLVGLLLDVEGVLTVLLTRGQVTTGATIGVRRAALDAIGGYAAVKDCVADDYALGVALRRAGLRLALARRAARMYAPGGTLREAMRWWGRWTRTVRAAAPRFHWAHAPFAFAPLLCTAALATPQRGAALGLLLAHTLLRATVALAVDLRYCRDGSLRRAIPLLPLLWLFEPFGWLVGTFGRTIDWRGRRYRLEGARATLVDR